MIVGKMHDSPYNARYEKLIREIRKKHLNILEIGDRLRQCGDPHIIGKRQYLSLAIGCAKKVYKVFHTDFRLIECYPELSLGTKILFVLRIVRDEGNLSQSPAYSDNDVTSFGDGPRQGTSFLFCHEFRDIIGYAQSRKVRAVDDRKARGDKTFDFQIRSEWSRGHILDVITYSALC